MLFRGGAEIKTLVVDDKWLAVEVETLAARVDEHLKEMVFTC
ncbi:hypothetical protein [Propionivibrio sp.]